MDLNEFILPKKLIEAFKDVNPIDEINKFLIGFEKASKCTYVPHLRNEDSLDFIDIPKDKMLVGEICNLTHGDCNYGIFNPCYDYFCECLFGSLFEVDFLKVNRIDNEVIGTHVQTISKFVNQRIIEREFKVKSHKIRVYILSWTSGQGGDPWYFAIDKEDLNVLCDSIFDSDGVNFSNYLCSRIAEYLYKVNIPSWTSLRINNDISGYIDGIVESRHFDDYHWWEER